MRQPRTVAPGLEIFPRSEWADADPTGPLEAEQDGDVRFLLVHHTASSNDYTLDEVPRLLRSFYSFHTGPEKNWPDIAYNFMVDRFGGVWEARADSLDAPIKGSASGGSQGFAMLCCLVGNHDEAPPTTEAITSLGLLLGWLADVYGIALGAEKTATFVSRGSNRWDEGVTVTTPTISGHRAMSLTTCPGDFAFDLLDSEVVPAAQAAAGQLPTTAAPPTTTAVEEATTTEATTTSTAPATTAADATAGDATAADATVPDSAAALAEIGRRPVDGDDTTRLLTMFGLSGVAALGLVGGLIAWRRRTLG